MKVPIYMFKNRKPEEWKKLTCDPRIKPMYQISNYGRIMNADGKILNGDVDKDGYIKYTLQGYEKKIRQFAHRLVAIEFIPNPNKLPEVNHIRVLRKEGYTGTCIHDDNYFENLEWATHEENIRHSRENHLQERRSCEASARAKVDNETVHMICLMLESGMSNVDIRRKIFLIEKGDPMDEQFRGLIKHVRSRKHWKEISKFYKF